MTALIWPWADSLLNSGWPWLRNVSTSKTLAKGKDYHTGINALDHVHDLADTKFFSKKAESLPKKKIPHLVPLVLKD